MVNNEYEYQKEKYKNKNPKSDDVAEEKNKNTLEKVFYVHKE